MDTGTVDSLLEASEFVKTIQNQQGILISSIHEIAYRNEWINKRDFEVFLKRYFNSLYGTFLNRVIVDVYKNN